MMTKIIRSTEWKRVLSLLLILFLLSALPVADAAEDSALCFDIVDGEAVVIDCDSSFSGALVIPSTVEGYPVTGIEESAFSSCSKLTGVTIPQSITSIGEQAFYGCTSLTAFTVDADNPAFTADENGVLYSKDKSVLIQYPTGKTASAFTVPNGVTTIGAFAFAHARNLQSVSLSDSVTEIEESAFYFCAGLTGMTITDGVTEIGFGAFEGCSKLASVTFGKGLSALGDNAFRLCKSLTQIAVDANNESFTTDENVLYNKDKTVLVQYPAGAARTSFTVPNGITKIGTYAFGYAEALQSVILPDGLTEFGEFAFYYCKKLETVNIPGSVTLIGGDAFRECDRLMNIVLPDGLTSIGYYAFYNCKSLTEIIIPDNVTHVGYQAFYGCTNLAFAHVPSLIEYMDWSVFDNCPNLAYLCADTGNCYAKTYAADNSVPFHVCGGRHPILVPHHEESLLEINAEYESGAFSGDVFLLAEPLSLDEVASEFPAYETGLACNPRETFQAAYRIRILDEAGSNAMLSEGQTVTLFIPVPENGVAKKSRVCHITGDAGAQTDSYKLNPKDGSGVRPFAMTEDGHYFIVEVDSFGIFLLVEETIAPTVSINNYTSYRKEGYKTTIHFSAAATIPPEGSTIHWFISDVDCGTGETFTMKRAKENYTVQVKLIDEDGVTVLAESESEWVTIQNGFWARLLGFLRMIVFMLPNITQ